MTKKECNIILFSITLCWSSSYLFIKSLPESLSSLNIVMVPLLLILTRKFPRKNQLLGMGVILLGILVTNGFCMQKLNDIGTVWMLLSCLLASVYTIVADKFTKEENPLLISALQMLMCGGISFILWYLEEPAVIFALSYEPQTISSLLILTLFSKIYAYIMLMYAQKYASPMDVTVIASTEPVVTLILAVLLPAAYGAGEAVRFEAFSGSILIALGAVVAGITFNNSNFAHKF